MSCEHEVEFAQRLAEVDARSKSNTKRLDKFDELVEVVRELATSMKLMAEKQITTETKVSQIDQKLEVLEQKPAKRWESIVEKIILTVVAALVGFVLATMGLTS